MTASRPSCDEPPDEMSQPLRSGGKVDKDAFRVCLISPPYDRQRVYSTMGFAAPIEPPIGLAYVAAMLRSQGFTVRLIDSTTVGYDIGRLQREITGWRPNVVGIAANRIDEVDLVGIHDNFYPTRNPGTIRWISSDAFRSLTVVVPKEN